MPINRTIISEDITKGRQSLIYRLVLKVTINGVVHTLRVVRKRDAYDSQSHATVSRWDGEKWHEVARIPWAEMAKTDDDTYVTRRPRTEPNDAESADTGELLRRAEAILS